MASAAPSDVAFKFHVQFESRDDGGLRAYSDDVPGFVLSNACADTVLEGVAPVLEVMLSSMFTRAVRVMPVRDLHDIKSDLTNAGILPSMPPLSREYVISQIAA